MQLVVVETAQHQVQVAEVAHSHALQTFLLLEELPSRTKSEQEVLTPYLIVRR